jgi:flagellar protein FlgJ
MRETVPADGLTSGGSGEEMFRGMLDQHLASAVPGQWHSGIGRSLLEQLRPSRPAHDSTTLSTKGTQ